jgi:hypothetical protein
MVWGDLNGDGKHDHALQISTGKQQQALLAFLSDGKVHVLARYRASSGLALGLKRKGEDVFGDSRRLPADAVEHGECESHKDIFLYRAGTFRKFEPNY